MRSFEERKAEVFRRSENRIKERKRNRNRILAMCIPICLVITVWSIMILPAMMPANKSNNSAGEGMDIMGGVDGTEAAFVRVEVMSTGTATQSAILKDDADKVAQIYHTMQSSFVNSSGGNKESVNDKAEDDALTEENKDYSQSGTTNLSSGFRIIFTTENGVQTIYSLSGDKLINETTKQETILTEDQRSNLLNMQILGTVKIADGIIDKSQAIEIAKKGITAKYDRTDAIFDSEKGLWTVSFYEKNRSEKVQSITVSYNGKVINKEAAK